MSTALVIVVVFAAVALGLAAAALLLAWSARGTALRAESRIGRHTQEHRLGIEDEGLRRHRADEPALTGQIARVDPYRPNVDDDGTPTAEHPAPRPLPGTPLPPPGAIRDR